MSQPPPRPPFPPGNPYRDQSYDYAVIRTPWARPGINHARTWVWLVPVIVALLVAFLWWRTAQQWVDHGCTGSQGLHYAITEGSPEWYQWCQEATPTP